MKKAYKVSWLVWVICAAISIAGCKKEKQTASNDELVIKLPPGLIHIGAQWVDGKVWVESFDPITNACLLRQYDAEGKVVDGSIKVRLKACRIEMPKIEMPEDEAKKGTKITPDAKK